MLPNLKCVNMEEKFLECRVSIPAQEKDHLLHGGESTCVEVISYIPDSEDEAGFPHNNKESMKEIK